MGASPSPKNRTVKKKCCRYRIVAAVVTQEKIKKEELLEKINIAFPADMPRIEIRLRTFISLSCYCSTDHLSPYLLIVWEAAEAPGELSAAAHRA